MIVGTKTRYIVAKCAITESISVTIRCCPHCPTADYVSSLLSSTCLSVSDLESEDEGGREMEDGGGKEGEKEEEVQQRGW